MESPNENAAQDHRPGSLAAGAAGRAARRRCAKPAKPNVLFLFSDDQRFDTIHALGNDHIRTPHLDRLAQSGTVFTRAYIMGGNSGAVCMPSRAMLMSGRTLFRIENHLKGQTTWPEKFGQAGYTTFITGKWHNGPESVLRSFQQGHAVFLGGMGNPYKLPLQDIGADHKFDEQARQRRALGETVCRRRDRFPQTPNRRQAVPLLLRPQLPARPAHGAAVVSRLLQRQPTAAAGRTSCPQHPFNNGEMAIRDELLAPWPRTPAVVRQNLADYYAYINYLDDQIGRILDALKASGQFDNTIIVFSSDNGLAIGSHGLFGKQNVYDHATHEPLIFAGPGIPAGQRRDAFCYLLDIFPTLGALAGVAAPDGNEGQSLVPVITGQAARLRDSIFTAYRHLHRAVRDDRWKLIVYTQINKTQLFDLQADPAETKDLAADKSHAAEIDRLTGLLKDWQQKLGDTQPLTTDKPQPLTFDFTKVKVGKRPKSGME